MPMVKCPDCENMISDSAPTCPHCGRPNSGQSTNSSGPNTENKSVSLLLGIGIFLIPFIFSWVTLKKGYSNLSRGIAFSWMAIALVAAMADPPSNSGTSGTASEDGGGDSGAEVASEPEPEEKSYPEKNDSYRQVNSAVGCDSKLSDDKKEDVFNSEYKDHWFTWRGTVVLAETGEASLNLDGVGTQDLQVDFADPETGYDLVKDSTITVKFLMKTAGGCWLPFSGDEAVIVN